MATHNDVPDRTTQDRFYFMLIMRKGDPVPAWAAGNNVLHRDIGGLHHRAPFLLALAAIYAFRSSGGPPAACMYCTRCALPFSLLR